MSHSTQTITLNGKLYDAVTGTLLSTQPAKKKTVAVMDVTHRSSHRRVAPSSKRHLQHARTLRRTGLKKPSLKKQSVISSHRRPISAKPLRPSHASSPHVRHFAKAGTPKKSVRPAVSHDAKLATEARILQQAHAHHQAVQTKLHTHHLSSRAIKEKLLEQQLDRAKSHEETLEKTPTLTRRWRMASIGLSSVALVFLAAYLTYVNIPNLSIKIASANAGINAELPHYQPAGFRLSGPISYDQGRVDVKYKQTGGDARYTLVQQPSSWDPQALLENMVTKEAKKNYRTETANGLTIYTFGDKAAWVNGGVLHTIDSNTPLSNDQISRIASSM